MEGRASVSPDAKSESSLFRVHPRCLQDVTCICFAQVNPPPSRTTPTHVDRALNVREFFIMKMPDVSCSQRKRKVIPLHRAPWFRLKLSNLASTSLLMGSVKRVARGFDGRNSKTQRDIYSMLSFHLEFQVKGARNKPFPVHASYTLLQIDYQQS
ncbi:hypothetical protein SCHPADRAFT_78427 [Schizopora paradoxa]|uniref:Uncharacterized protein n=1 Tax=Schizopora paradoxa TaxID=27342 RepID=A0A0H2SBT5_9AGAM|nr:hypothetical protein SCHPADRAFT_78427 [Schizopora paradoxa]